MAQRDEHGHERIVSGHLPGLLPPGEVLVLQISLGLLCLRCEQGELRLMSVQPQTLEERPLLQAFPASATDALVLASIQHVTAEGARNWLSIAWLQGEAAWTASLQPLRTVLGSLRHKLHACRIALVAVQRRGSLLKQWKETP